MTVQATLFHVGVNPDPSFFNTIHLERTELKEAKQQTGKQDERVLEIFKQHGKLTPLECSRLYNGLFPVAPFTSIRRSITVLTGLGMLLKTNETKLEIYGKPNYVWQVAK